MLTKLKLWLPLLLVLAIAMLALPTKPVMAIPSCTRLVSIEAEFFTVFSLTPLSPTLFEAPVFGAGALFINNRRVGGLVTIDQTVDFGVVPTLIDGNAKLIASNGSRIFIKGTGTGAPVDAEGNSAFSGTWLIYGGTKTYAGAVGTADFEGFANIPTLTGYFTAKGHIRIPCTPV